MYVRSPTRLRPFGMAGKILAASLFAEVLKAMAFDISTSWHNQSHERTELQFDIRANETKRLEITERFETTPTMDNLPVWA